jgi:ubiquinone/menaquinone biosynthesis C-methylase UbiE
MQCTLAARYDGRVVGLDESAQMLGLTQRRARRTGQQVSLLRGSSRALPLEGGSFQSVLATFPSDYIVQPATLAEIRRVLSADGRLVVVDAPDFTTPGIYEQAINLLYRLAFLKPLASGSSKPDDSKHISGSGADFPYRPIFERAGFDVQVFCEQVGHSQIHIVMAQPD